MQTQENYRFFWRRIR